MKIGIFDPYLDTLGGGEKYMLTLASYLSVRHDVSVFWDFDYVLHKAEKKFMIDTSRIHLTRNIFSTETSVFIRMLQTKRYDVIFYLSDGSIPWLFAKKNILLFQFPVPWVDGNVVTTKLKLAKMNTVLCNSYFVKSFIDKTFHLKSYVLPPPVTMITPGKKKENIILTVGRFTKGMNMKKQEEMIEAFILLCRSGIHDWQFVIIGSVLPFDKQFIMYLKNKAKRYPIEILDNASWETVISYYQKAKIYWHGAGFGENLKEHPERAEHFGISTVEAMSAGCVPIVFNAGGQREIVENNESGFLWNSIDELLTRTQDAMKNKTAMKTLIKNAEEKAKMFSEKHFKKSVIELIRK